MDFMNRKLSFSLFIINFRVKVMVFNTTFYNISTILWCTVLLMEETGVSGEINRHVVSHIMLYHIHILFHFSDASGHIKLWHYTSGICLNTMLENRQSLNVAYSPDGKRLVTTGETPEIYVYDRETRERINTLESRYFVYM